MKKITNLCLSLTFIAFNLSTNVYARSNNICPDQLTAQQYREFVNIGQSKVSYKGKVGVFHFIENGTPSQLNPKLLKHLLKNTPRLESEDNISLVDKGYASTQITCRYSYHSRDGDIKNFTLVSIIPDDNMSHKLDEKRVKLG